MDEVQRLLGTCPICEGTYKLTDAEKMVHHGYSRPGDGMIHGDCYAVGHPPYEVSCEVTKEYRGLTQETLKNAENHLQDLANGKVTHFWSRGYRSMQELAVGVTDLATWEWNYHVAMNDAKHRVRELQQEILRLNLLIHNWRPQDIRTVMEAKAKNEKAERDARAATVREARAARKAVEEAKRVKRDALKARRDAVLAGFRARFVALVANPNQGDLLALRSELELKKNHWINLHELKCDAELVLLGVGYEEKGRVWYRWH